MSACEHCQREGCHLVDREVYVGRFHGTPCFHTKKLCRLCAASKDTDLVKLLWAVIDELRQPPPAKNP